MRTQCRFNREMGVAVSALLGVVLTGCGTPRRGAVHEPRLQLSAAGQALVAIVVADEPTPAERTAAQELATFLGKITGATFELAAEAGFDGATPAIYVGHTAFAQKAGVDLAQFGEEEWAIRTVENALVIAGGRPRGTLFGVYEFLERHAGCAWLDADTEIVPKRTDFELRAMDERARPAFWSRSYYTGFSRGAGSFHVRNKHMLHSYDAKYGYQAGFGAPRACHTFYDYSKDWPDNPEYWAFDNGRRHPRPSSPSTGQFCLTHPEVRELTLAQLRKYLRLDRERAADKGAPPPRIYDISHNDGLGYCLCPGCSAVLEREGAYSGVLLDFINQIARGIAHDYPDVLIQTFAYTFTLDPPRHIRPGENVMIQVCDLGSEWYPITRSENLRSVLHPDNSHFREAFEAWARIANHLAVWDYWKIYKITFPYTNVSHIQADLKFFRDHGVGRLFVECEDLDNGSFATLKQWLGLKMMQDPERSVLELIDLFMRGYYGPAAAAMTEYLAYLEERIEQTPGSFGRRHPKDWDYFDVPFFVTVNELLDRAETLAADCAACLAHVRRERVPVDYAMLFMWDRLEDGWPRDRGRSLDKQEVIARYETNKTAAIRLYYSGDRLAKKMGDLANEIRLFHAMPIPVPEPFQGKQMVDLLWRDFPGASRVDDPDATAGVAVRLGPRPDRPDFHDRPLTMGIYDRIRKEAGPGIAVSKENIPRDGAYHFYKIGSFPIGEQTIAWFHWSWLIQIGLGRAYQAPLVRTMDVHASVKVTGPAYVEGSAEENAVYVDRIILVEPDQ